MIFEKICFGIELAATSVLISHLKWHLPQPRENDIVNVMALLIIAVIFVREFVREVIKSM